MAPKLLCGLLLTLVGLVFSSFCFIRYEPLEL